MRCPSLPSTGDVSIKLTGGLNFQAIATYSCPANKCLYGNKVRRCQANGQWSGTQPSCLSKDLGVYFKEFLSHPYEKTT